MDWTEEGNLKKEFSFCSNLTVFNLATLIGLVILLSLGCDKKEHHKETGHIKEYISTVTYHHEEPAEKHEHRSSIIESGALFSGKLINGVREIKVVAFQFGFKPAPIIIKKGEQVRLILESTDVIHGIGIKAFAVNQVLPPNEEKVVEFTADKTGSFHIHCTIYCGVGHGKMHGTLIVKE